MFTGIVTDVGSVRSAEQRGDLRLVVETAYDLDGVDLGASISCSGVCLTVVDKGDDWFAVDVSGETISKTAGEHWQQGGVSISSGRFALATSSAAISSPAMSMRLRSSSDVRRWRFDAHRRQRHGVPGADDRAQGLDHARRRFAHDQ